MRAPLISTILLLMLATPAQTGPADDCNQVADLNRQLRGCTAYIMSGKVEPQNLATAYLNRANIYAQRRQYARALADYDTASQLDPTNPLIAYNQGNTHLDSRQYGNAAEAFTRAIELDATFALAYLNRGIAREALGDTAGAAEDYQHTLELEPGATAARLRLKGLRKR
jgi:tetratricopeptide (TPR) repeat protein